MFLVDKASLTRKITKQAKHFIPIAANLSAISTPMLLVRRSSSTRSKHSNFFGETFGIERLPALRSLISDNIDEFFVMF